MREQHLSDEAVAACADDALGRGAGERAGRHIAGCPECAYAVAVQREAMFALRSAAAPSLPHGLFARLCDVAVTTPISQVPSTIDDHGTAMFATFGSASAFVAPTRAGSGSAADDAVTRSRLHRPAGQRRTGVRRPSARRPIVLSVAAVAVAGGLLGVTAVSGGSGSDRQQITPAYQPIDPTAVPRISAP